MNYELFFDIERIAPGIKIGRQEWGSLKIFTPKPYPEITSYLGGQPTWQAGQEGWLGYNGCLEVREAGEPVEIYAPLHQTFLGSSLLSFSFLISHLNRACEDLPESGLELRIGCGRSPFLAGYVSPAFQNALGLLTPVDLLSVQADMGKAWQAVVERRMKKYAKDCSAQVVPVNRFSLECFGNACDVAIYPDSDPMFSCHNLDNVRQQATLLAGLCSLAGRVSRREGV